MICFWSLNSLKYINLINAQINNNIKNALKDKVNASTIVCQNTENEILLNMELKQHMVEIINLQKLNLEKTYYILNIEIKL